MFSLCSLLCTKWLYLTFSVPFLFKWFGEKAWRPFTLGWSVRSQRGCFSALPRQYDCEAQRAWSLGLCSSLGNANGTGGAESSWATGPPLTPTEGCQSLMPGLGENSAPISPSRCALMEVPLMWRPGLRSTSMSGSYWRQWLDVWRAERLLHSTHQV